MTLALLSTPEQIKQDKKGMNLALNQLLHLVMDAAKGNRFRCDDFHVSEPLGVFVKMFIVEERTLDYILCYTETEPSSDMVSTIRLFISLFMDYVNAFKGIDCLEQFTRIALLNILWNISFQANYTQELALDEKLIMTIRGFLHDESEQEMLEQYKPHSMEGALQAAHSTKLTDVFNTVLLFLAPSKAENVEHLPPSPQHYDPVRPIYPVTFSTVNWFAHHRISKELRNLFDFQTGEEILDYARLLDSKRSRQTDEHLC
ncbi:unnamed protein product [Rotaria sp. Silwood2]|nr:unnamed protein product [Rotaria sp. Silwood2]CAF3934221.1 unnamed protein product [Rotaria sp. Silwood2]